MQVSPRLRNSFRSEQRPFDRPDIPEIPPILRGQRGQLRPALGAQRQKSGTACIGGTEGAAIHKIILRIYENSCPEYARRRAYYSEIREQVTENDWPYAKKPFRQPPDVL